ncbi:DJ-1 family glyoxalase III [Anaerococcus jeddahensis]|uniref:DJ-1 family glyoxalase III n=1 Tax=Anaerococcus jeddahensis TaxID=1673719 RepID=UPI0006723D6B|nr:DJ-1 family glyoxalase III [Anaerococcus jeddahensis]
MDKVLVFLADGFEEIEALTIVDYLRRVNIPVDTVSIKTDYFVNGSHQIIVKADKLIDQISLDDYCALYIPGGTMGAENLRDDDRVIEILKNFDEDKKTIAAICAGPIVLDRAGILCDKSCVSHPSVKDELFNIGEYKENDLVVCDGNILTSRGAGASIYLALKLIEKINGADFKEKLKPGIQQDFVEKYFDFNF